METPADIYKLPFEEYAKVMAERGAREHGNPDTPKLTFDELVASELTADEIYEQYGEETAINVGIARDPDAPELDDEWFARARPAIEVHPELVEYSLRRRGQTEGPDQGAGDSAAGCRHSGPPSFQRPRLADAPQ